MVEKKFKLTVTISSNNPLAIKPILEIIICNDGTIKALADGLEVAAEFTGARARDLNRILVSDLRRAKKKTRIRSEWTCEDTTEKFFGYALKQIKEKQAPNRFIEE